jgi:hypothetical protein
MPPLAARCHLGLAELHAPPDGQEHLTRVTTILGELGMHFWLGQAAATQAAAG